MKRTRTKQPTVNSSNIGVPISVMSALLNRAQLAGRLGMDTYGGDRDIYNALGYPRKVAFKDFLTRYVRQDIAKAIIDRPVKASWKGDIQVIDNVETKKTKFEKAWERIYKDLNMKSVFMRTDRLTGLGRYSVMLLGLNDVRNEAGFAKPVSKNKRLRLLYVKPFSEQSATIQSYETNQTNKRYGLPKYYEVKITESDINTSGSTATSGAVTKTIKVHHSRIIHITEDVLESEVFGTPRLEAIYNRLIDLEKVIGGDAEMFWRGARPGYVGKVDPDYEMGEEERKDLRKQIEEFEHNLKRVLVNEGVDYKALEQQVSEPTSHVDVIVQMISAVTGIPKRILVGSERGELSSAQDKQEWISYVTGRREEQNEPAILRPFIDTLINLGVVPAPKEDEYTVIWDKLFSLSDKEKIEVGKQRAIALREYSTNPAAQYLIPYEAFLSHLMGFDIIQIEKIKTLREEDGIEERTLEEIAELNSLGKRAADSDSKTTRKLNEEEGMAA